MIRKVDGGYGECVVTGLPQLLPKIEFTDVSAGETFRNLPVATCEFARRE